MFQLYASCRKWVYCKGLKVDTNEQYSLEIILKNGSILESYFCISDYRKPMFLMPVSKEIFINYVSSIFEFSVNDLAEYHVQFQIDDSVSLECLVSQFSICSSINTITDDIFKQENLLFLQKFHNSSRQIERLTKVPSMIFPPCTDRAARYTWESRCIDNNVHFLLKSGKMTIVFITWNVGQEIPTSDAPLQIASILHDSPPPDVVFITLQEVDFSAKALVSGQSNIKDQWTKVIRQALRLSAISRVEHKKRLNTASQPMSSPLPKTSLLSMVSDENSSNSNLSEIINQNISEIAPPQTSEVLSSVSSEKPNSANSNATKTTQIPNNPIGRNRTFSFDSLNTKSGLDHDEIDNEKYEYALMREISIGSVYFAAFARTSTEYYCAVDEPNAIRLGGHGLTANKAALLVPFVFGEEKMLVAAVHLPPYAKNNAERLNQLHQLLDKERPHFDHIVLFGDLNFRLLIDRETIINHCHEPSFLLNYDQLHPELSNPSSPVYQFTEPPISFKPTYRYDKGTDVYDSSLKKRVPAYTDRILEFTSPVHIIVSPENSQDLNSNSSKSSEKVINSGEGSSTKNIENDTNKISENHQGGTKISEKGNSTIKKEPQIRIETDIIRQILPEVTKTFKTPDCFKIDPLPPPSYPKKPQCIAYSAGNAKLSDHKPVVGIFQYDFAMMDDNRLDKLREIMDAKMHERFLFSRPILKAAPNKVVLHLCSSTNSSTTDLSSTNSNKDQENCKKGEIVLKNDSNAWARWRATVLPPGIKIEPNQGIVYCGGTQNVTITLLANNILHEDNRHVALYVTDSAPVIFEILDEE